MKKTILSNRVYKNKKYSLVETLDNINKEKDLLKESFAFELMHFVYRVLTEIGIDAPEYVPVGGEAYGVGMFFVRLAKNTVELMITNRRVKKVLNEINEKLKNNPNYVLTKSDVKKLEKVRKSLGIDIADVAAAALVAFPIPVIDLDELGAIALEAAPVTSSSVITNLILKPLENSDSKLAYYFKKTTVYDSIVYLGRINDILINNRKKLNETKDEDEESFEELDLEEFSGSIALGGGPALPLGQKPKYFDDPEKALEEQIERMRILETFHQKTSNKLK